MSQKSRLRKVAKGRPIPSSSATLGGSNELRGEAALGEAQRGEAARGEAPEERQRCCLVRQLQPVDEDTHPELSDDIHSQSSERQLFKSEAERFIEISKYFSNPLRKTASYICENRLVSYPNPYRIEYKRGGVTTQHIKFSNLTLEPVYIKLYKLIPDVEELKFVNLSLSRCKRIPPGLSFSLGFVYDDVNEKPSTNAKMIFVASRKTTTPCYQVCEIDLQIEALKIRLVTI